VRESLKGLNSKPLGGGTGALTVLYLSRAHQAQARKGPIERTKLSNSGQNVLRVGWLTAWATQPSIRSSQPGSTNRFSGCLSVFQISLSALAITVRSEGWSQ